MNQFRLFCLVILLLSINFIIISAQEKKSKIESMTREEIMQMSSEQLLALPFEDLLSLSQKLGVSIDELLKMHTSVASRTELTPRETPGIISIITSEEIRYSGARDLMDVLKLVPGFDFEYDVDGAVGLGFRGSWVHEGKILMLMDGQMMNDLVYYNTPFGNHFDVSQIKKIEIVRGPGSAIYGGNAELGVINIITKSGEDLKGVSLAATYGQLPGTYGRANGSIMAGTKTGKWDLALKAFVGEANRSGGKYITNPDSGNQPYVQDFAKNGSKIKTQNVNLSATRENLSFQFIYDNYNAQVLSFGDNTLSFNKFKNITTSLKYDVKISPKVSLTPVISYQYSQPFNDTLITSRVYTVQRFKVGAGLNYIVSENLNLISGGEFYHDNGEISDNAFGSHHLQLNNAAAYVQLFWKISHFNMVAGGRAEHNNTYGSAFVPRVAITRIINNFHFKLLASEAFRSPSVGNIDVSSNLKVEKTLVFETEIGYKLNNNMFITGNIFDISITNPITYYSNGGEIPLLDWYYKNAVKQGSDGVELEYRYKYAWGSSAISYSFYTDKWKSIPDLYKAEGHANAVLGLPQHKFTLLNTFRINNRANVSPSVVYSGSRYGYVQDDSWNTVIKKYDPSLMLNVNFSFDNFLTRGLTLDLGAFNILNQKSPLIQPYNGGDPPYPGREREFLARLVYSFRAGR